MERLQAAIEKARVQRDQQGERGIRPLAAASALAADAPSEWQELTQITLVAKHLRRGRINAPDGGHAENAPFDLLRTRMLQLCKQNNWHRVAIVSPHAGCGKSTTAANLAFSLARQSELNSLVFDFDLRRSGLSRLLGQRPRPGMTAVLEERAEFSDAGLRYGDNLAFGLLSETPAKTPSELLQSSRAAGVLNRIETRYGPDLMLFDMPPLMSSDDNYGFLQNVDCALILAAAEETAMTQIDVAERQVSELTNVLGVVLNKCRYTSGAFGHSYESY
ncbi:CpsD/CapB family tyrosine-protein kinase [Epibacterium ulvae]|uniref:CpsD/CapB family tyrosine-protein kinase n=1 Tax=Epibacterium ulvae TaxID=1156985 RepID=UPI001BFC325A|nr:CpsD/CapB family tyrosine-protein kinase [Epibacterium ulvae]MBT8154561.1 CpsD/CapB family tyrosine-protein kinase [Epibacterium ulvae]